MLRNLVYNCAPLESGAEVWRDNLRWLRRYMDAFNNRRLMVVRTGEGLESADAVKAEFGVRDVEYIELPNHPGQHEAAGFIDILSMLKSSNPDEAIFYAHDKGVTHPQRREEIESYPCESFEHHMIALRQLRNRMYHECLHDVGKIESILTKYAACGSFWGKPSEKMLGSMSSVGLPVPENVWMFSGSFYWVNSARLFSHPNWTHVVPHRIGPEIYLAGMFSRQEVFELLPLPTHFRLTWDVIGNYSCETCGEFNTIVSKRARCPKCKKPVGGYVAIPSMFP